MGVMVQGFWAGLVWVGRGLGIMVQGYWALGEWGGMTAFPLILQRASGSIHHRQLG